MRMAVQKLFWAVEQSFEPERAEPVEAGVLVKKFVILHVGNHHIRHL